MPKKKLKLLIVDDEKDICKHEENIFMRRGFETYSARNESQAVSWAKKVMPDIAIIDIHLGKEDGINTLKRILEVSPCCRNIMVTWDKEKALEAKKVGAVGFVIKPTVAEELVKAVGKAAKNAAKK